MQLGLALSALFKSTGIKFSPNPASFYPANYSLPVGWHQTLSSAVWTASQRVVNQRQLGALSGPPGSPSRRTLGKVTRPKLGQLRSVGSKDLAPPQEGAQSPQPVKATWKPKSPRISVPPCCCYRRPRMENPCSSSRNGPCRRCLLEPSYLMFHALYKARSSRLYSL